VAVIRTPPAVYGWLPKAPISQGPLALSLDFLHGNDCSSPADFRQQLPPLLVLDCGLPQLCVDGFMGFETHRAFYGLAVLSTDSSQKEPFPPENSRSDSWFPVILLWSCPEEEI